MASSAKRKKLNDEANGTRISQLLVNKGTEALRQTFDKYNPPSQLQTVLNTKQAFLHTLKRGIINDDQWNLLYPASGNPDSKKFDITLLSVLLRNICNLKPPATGWSTMPLETDRSEEANLLRIKLYRNKILAHAPSTEVSESQFHDLWPKISQTLQDLGIPQPEIDELKTCHLSPEEENYIKILGDWKSKDDALHETLDEMNVSVTKILKTTEEIKESIPESMANQGKEIKESIANKVEESFQKMLSKLPSQADADENLLTQKLCKFTFRYDIKKLIESFHPGTRKWLFTKVDNWFTEQESKVFVLTAGPGVGKSVLAAKMIELYKEKESLAACHFCKFNDSNRSNPEKMIQSLASQMCDSVKGFKEKLLDQLKRPNKVQNLQDAFQVYLKEPLQQLPENKPMLVVIDGLDECESDQRIELLNVLAKEFSKLPPWVKVLVTSRPEMNVQEKLSSLEYMEIATDKNNEDDTNNEEDIKLYLRSHLLTISKRNRIISFITKKCEGSFLFASYLQKHLQNCKPNITKREINSQLPRGINSVYQDYFARLRKELEAVSEEYDIFHLLEIIAAAHGPIPLSFITEGIKRSLNQSTMKDIIGKVNENVSTLLYVNNDLVTVFHKSVIDWLKLNGDNKHEYTVNCENGNKLLWNISKEKFEQIKKDILAKKDSTIVDELKRNKAMKYALEKGFNHLPLPSSNWSKMEDYEWLVDVVILHVMFDDNSRTVMEHWKNFKEADSHNSSMTILKNKISWHYNHFSSLEVVPIYVQDIVNEGPSDIFSLEEKDIAKHVLHTYVRFWCEKLNPSLESNIPVTACAFSPDGSRLVSCAKDGKIHIWNINSFQVVQEVSSDCKQVICCLWSDEISIFHYDERDLVLSKYPVNEDSKIEERNMTTRTFGSDKFTPLAFCPKAFIYRCTNDSTIRVRRLAKTNEISLPELKAMEKFAVSRDGSLIMAANKDNFEIWKIDGDTPIKCHSAESLGFLPEKEINCKNAKIKKIFNCSISCVQKRGIISCLCSKAQFHLHIFLIDKGSGSITKTNPVFHANDTYDATDEILAAETIDDNFLCLQSGKHTTVHLIGYREPLIFLEHKGYPNYYKVGSICRSKDIIALPQESGGIWLVKLHLPNVDMEPGAFKYNRKIKPRT